MDRIDRAGERHLGERHDAGAAGRALLEQRDVPPRVRLELALRAAHRGQERLHGLIVAPAPQTRLPRRDGAACAHAARGGPDGIPHARSDRHPGEHAVPRRHDVRVVGQPRPRRVDQHHPRRARRGHQLHRHRRRLLERRVGGDRREGTARPSRRRRARDEGARHHGHRSQPAGELPPLDPDGGREQPAPAEDRLDRPLPDPPSGSDPRRRRDARCAHRPRARRQGARDRLVDLPGGADRGGAVGRRAAQPRTLPLRAASVLDPRARHRALGAAHVRALRHGRDRVEPAQRRMAQRQVPARSGVAGRQPRRDGHVLRAREEAQPAQVRRGRATREGRRRCRAVDDAPRDRVEPRAPGRDVDDHRPEDDGAAHRSPRRRRCAPRCRGARPHRRDRPSGRDPRRARRGLRAARAGGGGSRRRR